MLERRWSCDPHTLLAGTTDKTVLWKESLVVPQKMKHKATGFYSSVSSQQKWKLMFTPKMVPACSKQDYSQQIKSGSSSEVHQVRINKLRCVHMTECYWGLERSEVLRQLWHGQTTKTHSVEAASPQRPCITWRCLHATFRTGEFIETAHQGRPGAVGEATEADLLLCTRVLLEVMKMFWNYSNNGARTCEYTKTHRTVHF